jgi:RHS repeat-associated protein
MQETVVAPGGTVSRATSFTYDELGNISTRTDNGVVRQFQYNKLDQLLNDGVRSYTYDGRGNVASMIDANGTAAVNFDATNRLSSVTIPGQGTGSYSYDGEDRRIAQIINGTSSQMLWDPASATQVPDVIMESNGPGNILASYAFGDRGPLWRGAAGPTAYYLEDGLHSTIGLTNPAGTLTDRYRYDAFGQSTLRTGTTANPFQYRGQWTDPLTGFQDLRARSYNPRTGRFLSRDTADFDLKDPVDFNRYRYGASNPVNAFDPTGHANIVEYIVARLPYTISASSQYVARRAMESFTSVRLEVE